ncbi:hypothetical protein LOTGIDRAFT_163394 [Lottia gigantea]|uniref:Serine protease n=1 Tax=Lottia gigantea TaxID=225164 RepID=V4AE90_LOTGI|nr:hypothetical protein LOTGIDRAFT_163394 [Lottia gigantea]ESO91666.1 hypothetical protein LOTGIDRAFT_163394 [Lottia gigantea]
MQVEIATEAVPDLTLVQTCTKNPNHARFFKFNGFRMENIPEQWRRPEILEYIKNIGIRVVRLTVKPPDREARYGSGAVYKGLGFYFVLTNDHVVENQTDVVNCTVDFFYDSEDQSQVVTSKGVQLVACSGLHDKSVFTIDTVPPKIMHITKSDDIAPWVKVFATLEDKSISESYGMLLKKWNEWYVWATVEESQRKPVVKCEIEFQAVKTERVYSTDIDNTDKMVIIKLQESTLPQVIKESSLLNTTAPWPRGNRDFIPVVIAHPHGGPKMISVGKLLAVEITDPVKPSFVYHTAETCPGSSGGLLITLGGDTLPYNGCANTIGMHREGDSQEEFRGIPIENKNLNLSMFQF